MDTMSRAFLIRCWFYVLAACTLLNSVAEAQVAGSLPSLAGIPAATASSPLAPFSRSLKDALRDQAENVRAIKSLPVRGLVMIETKDGKTFLISEDGRLAIIGGRWVDLWEKRDIKSIADSSTLSRLDLARVGVDPAEITSLSLGTGAKTATLFLDPLCSQCPQLAKQVQALSTEFTFRIVLVPLKPGESLTASRKLSCATDRALASAAFYASSYGSLPDPPASCDGLTLGKGVAVAAALSIRQFPFLIRPDGLVAYGPSLDLAAALRRPQ
jgi:thiol:disulfide interchange protein DsbC